MVHAGFRIVRPIPDCHDAIPVALLTNLDTGNAQQKSEKGCRILRLENPGHFLTLELDAININSLPVVAIELLGDFAQRTMIEHQLALDPGQGRRNIDTVLWNTKTGGCDDDTVVGS